MELKLENLSFLPGEKYATPGWLARCYYLDAVEGGAYWTLDPRANLVAFAHFVASTMPPETMSVFFNSPKGLVAFLYPL